MIAVITGATKGIGHAIAKQFASKKFDLVITSRSQSDLDKLKDEWQTQYEINIHALASDLSIAREVSQFGDFALLAGSPAVLVNNAGVFLPGNIHDEAADTFSTLMNTNVASAYHLTRALLPSMMTQKNGHIFNVCSTASIKAYTQGGSYCISKFALLGFSKVLREELMPHNIGVTALMPGATLTDSWKGTELPNERFMNPDDIGQLVWDVYALSKRTVVEEIILRPMLGDL